MFSGLYSIWIYGMFTPSLVFLAMATFNRLTTFSFI
jgi:hypothetical protein